MTCLDHDVIAELRDILGEELQEIVTEFVDQFREHAPLMRASLQRGDLHELSRIAHQLKGSASNFGARALAERCLVLESAARAEDEQACMRALDDAIETSEQCFGELDAAGLLSDRAS